MKKLLLFLLGLLPIVASAQLISNPRAQIRDSLSLNILYEVTTDVPKNTYAASESGYAQFNLDVKAGRWNLTLDNGAFIPKGTIPPYIAPLPTGQSGPSWASLLYSMNGVQFYGEGAGSELAKLRFQLVDGTKLTGINPDGVNLTDTDFFGFGDNSAKDPAYPKKWVATFSPSIVGKNFRITAQRTNGDLFVKEFVPAAGANRVQLYVASGGGNTSPPTTTTTTTPTTPVTVAYDQSIESEAAQMCACGQDVFAFPDGGSSGSNITCCFTNSSRYLDYSITGVPGAGSLTLKLTYQTNTSETATASIIANGQTQSLALSGLGGGKATASLTIQVIAGTNSIRIAGNAGTFLQDKIQVFGSITTGSSGGGTTTPPTGNVTTTYPSYTLGFMLGNSLTTYRASTVPNEWPYNNAMAVDAPQYDNAHIVEAGLKTVNPSFQLALSGNGSGLEQAYNSSDPDAVSNNITLLKNELARDYPGKQFNPFIFSFGGENTGGTFNESKQRAMFDAVLAAVPRPTGGKIIFRTSFYKGKDQVDAVTLAYCAEKGIDVVNLSDVQERSDLVASEYLAAPYNNAGWAKHPNRNGHAVIGGRYLDKLKITSSGGGTTQPPSTTTTGPTTTVGAGQGLYALNSTYTALSEAGGRPGYAQPSWISNGTMNLGLTPTAGDVLTHFQEGTQQSVFNNPQFAEIMSGTNTRVLDLGRQGMDAAYSYPDGSYLSPGVPNEGHYTEGNQSTGQYKGNGGSIGWNPVQGGDESYKGQPHPNPNASPVLTHYVDGSKAYYKVQPMQWDMNNVKGKMYMEGWVNWDPSNSRAFRWHRRWTMFRDDSFINDYQTPRRQESPCIYTTPGLRKYYYCIGQPYTNADLVERDVVNNRNFQQIDFYSTEPFIFSVNPDNGKTLCLLTHNARWSVGRFVSQEPGWDNPIALDAGYLQSGIMMTLDPDGVYDFDAAIGYFNSLSEARQWAYAQPRWNGLPEYRFDQVTKTRMGFYLHHAQDQREKNMNGSLDVRPILLSRANNGTDMKFCLPDVWINGRTVQHLYLKANITSSTNQFWVNWRKAGDETDYHKVVTIPNDGADHVTDLDMSGEPNWAGKDIVQCSISHVYSGSWPSVTNDVWKIKYVSYRNLN